MDSSIFSIYKNVDAPEISFDEVEELNDVPTSSNFLTTKLDTIKKKHESNWYKNLKFNIQTLQENAQAELDTTNNYSEEKGKYSLNKNVNTAKTFFKSKGLGISAYGFIGNFLGESGMDPSKINIAEAKHTLGYGAGIYLLTGSRKQAYQLKYGKRFEQASLTEQLNYAWNEAILRPSLINNLKKIDEDYYAGKINTLLAIERATSTVLLGFENGSKNGAISVSQFNKIYTNNSNNGKSYQTHLKTRTLFGINAYLS